MAVTGFNVGNTLNLEDMQMAIQYLQNKDLFEPDLQEVKQKITSKEKEKALTKKETTYHEK